MGWDVGLWAGCGGEMEKLLPLNVGRNILKS